MSVRLAELIGNAHAFESLDEFRHGIPALLREFVPPASPPATTACAALVTAALYRISDFLSRDQHHQLRALPRVLGRC